MVIRESPTCNRAREVVIFISANAEAAICCSIARERIVYNNMQDLNKPDAANISVIPCPACYLRKGYRVSLSECLGINLDAVPTNLKAKRPRYATLQKQCPLPMSFPSKCPSIISKKIPPILFFPCVFCCFAKARS